MSGRSAGDERATGPVAGRFNLSEWALAHRSLVWYLMLVSLVAGTMAYVSLGREEDPSFTVKTMVVTAAWPGATAEEMARQVTERIERRLEELPTLDETRSLSAAGRAIVYVDLQDSVRGQAVSDTWLRVRNMIEDIRADFPQGVVGPFYDDRFGDVYGSIYAFSAPDLDGRELLDVVEGARSAVLRVPDIGQVEIIGDRERVIYVELSTARLAALKLDPRAVVQVLQGRTAVTGSGVVDDGEERVRLRVGGQSATAEELRRILLPADGSSVRLGDVATVRAGPVDPPEALFRFDGEPAVALAIGMRQGANLLEFGEALEAELDPVRAALPLGVTLSKVADQPQVVDEAIGGFTRALFEAVVIVLAISFMSLGLRAGLVITVSIPLVLAITFVVLQVMDITLQRVSLGALIIALGLLVDDAMIAVEMMIARLEAGDTLERAATHIYTSTAFPMLTGTLVTVAGFVPIGLNPSSAGEFTFTLFVVIAVSLVVSWVVAVLCAPLLGVTLLRAPKRAAGGRGGAGTGEAGAGEGASGPARRGRFARAFSHVLAVCMRFRWLTIGASVATLALAVAGLPFVERQFFPESDRPELVVEFDLRDGAAIGATDALMRRFETEVLAPSDDVALWSTYVGRGAPRFLLTFESPLPAPSTGQIIVLTKDLESRARARAAFEAWLGDHVIDADVSVKLLDIGPPSGKPVQYRLSGADIGTLRAGARELAAVVAADPYARTTGFDWMEPARAVRANVLADRAQALGVSPTDVARALDDASVGRTVAQVRDGVYLVDVVARVEAGERESIESLGRIEVHGSSGVAVPLGSVATLSYGLEQPAVWRRSRVPTITVQSELVAGVQPASVHRAARARHRRLRGGPAERDARRARRRGREQRQVAGPDRGRGAAHAAGHGDDPDGPAAELPAVAAGVRDRALRARGRGGGAAADGGADGLRGDPGRAGARRDTDPELGDPDRADRGPARGGRRAVARRDRGDRAPHAPDPAHGGGRDPRADPDLARRVLGADGLRDDGRHRGGDRADAAVPAGAVRGLVPRAATDSTGRRRDGAARG